MKYTEVAGVCHDFLGNFNNKDDLEKNRTLDKYKAAMDSQQTISLKFEGVDSLKNEAYVENNGVRIITKLGELMQSSDAHYLGKTAITRVVYTVKVTQVDEVSGCVYCSVVDEKQSAKMMYTAAIEDALAKNKTFCVRTKVVFVDVPGRRIFVDIAGVGIQGIITLAEWSKNYTSSFKGIVYSGDIIPVVITGKTHAKGRPAYACSRRLAVLNDSWNNIEERYPVGSLVTIKCIQMREKSFFGSVEGLKDIEVFCEYPMKQTDSKGNPLIIEEGRLYMGMIYRVSEERRMLKARILYKMKER